MPRPTLLSPEKGGARDRLLEAAMTLIRRNGFSATSVDTLCAEAEVTKGAFFHHFASKEALGVAAVEHWTAMTGAFFEAAPYHAAADPLDRVLAYVAFRRSLIAGEIEAFTCVAGTMAQEMHATSPEIRAATGQSILGHAATLEADIAAAMAERGMEPPDWTAASLARHTQGVIQGGFILAKAGADPALAVEAMDHLDRYIRLLFTTPSHEGDTT